MPAPRVELIRPPFYPGDRVPSWLRHQRGWHVVPTPGNGELLVPDSFDYANLFPAGHVPPPLRLSAAHPHAFSAFLPPPFRVLLLIAFGILTFAADIHILHRLGLDPWPLLTPPPRSGSHIQNLLASKAERSPQTSTDVNSREGSSGGSVGSSSSSSASAPTAPPSAPSTYFAPAGTHYEPIYALGFLSLLWALAGWIVFRLYVDVWAGDPSGRHAQTLQGVAILGFLVIAVWPGDVVHRAARSAFGRALRRILSLSPVQHITFADVILADVLTSFAKVLGDVWLTACFLVPRAEHHTWWSGRGSIAVPLLTSLPYAIRLRQCVSEYIVSRRSADTGRRSRRPLANAVKYASAFPVIWLSALQGADVGVGLNVPGYEGEDSLAFQFWLLSVFVNSFFSFWWDVTNDWGLDILRWNTWADVASGSSSLLSSTQGGSLLSSLHRRGRSSISYSLGRLGLSESGTRSGIGRGQNLSLWSGGSEKGSRPLTGSNGLASANANMGHNDSDTSVLGPHLSQPHMRNVVHTRAPSRWRAHRPSAGPAPLAFPVPLYQVAVVLDLLLRFLWSIKLSSHLHHVVELEEGILVLELLEIFRRAGWVLLRVEWEHVKGREMRESEGRIRRVVEEQEEGIHEGRSQEDNVLSVVTAGGRRASRSGSTSSTGAGPSALARASGTGISTSASTTMLEMERFDA